MLLPFEEIQNDIINYIKNVFLDTINNNTEREYREKSSKILIAFPTYEAIVIYQVIFCNWIWLFLFFFVSLLFLFISIALYFKQKI